MTLAKQLKILHATYPNPKFYLNAKTPLEILVGTILSPQVRDEVVNEALPGLFNAFKTPQDFANATEEEIQDKIAKITFAKDKSKRLKAACAILLEEHQGNVPKTVKELTALPGVGKKTAFSILQNAYGIVEGVIVDTHVLRVSYRLGWTSHNKNANIVEKELEEQLDKKEWKNIPYILKAHGRGPCTPKPKCDVCPLNKICPKKGI